VSSERTDSRTCQGCGPARSGPRPCHRNVTHSRNQEDTAGHQRTRRPAKLSTEGHSRKRPDTRGHEIRRPRVQIPSPRPDFVFRIVAYHFTASNFGSQPCHRFSENLLPAAPQKGACEASIDLVRGFAQPTYKATHGQGPWSAGLENPMLRQHASESTGNDCGAKGVDSRLAVGSPVCHEPSRLISCLGRPPCRSSPSSARLPDD
jgi:hypothetical protein